MVEVPFVVVVLVAIVLWGVAFSIMEVLRQYKMWKQERAKLMRQIAKLKGGKGDGS